MNTSKNEFLSAFLDDEAGEFERRRLCDELKHDDALGQTLSRYALAGEVIRSKQRTVIKDNSTFLAGIQAQLEEEPDYNETVVQFAAVSEGAEPVRAGSWRTNAMRYGMAASVAVAALAGVLLLQPNTEQQLANAPEATKAMQSNAQAPSNTVNTLLATQTQAVKKQALTVADADASRITQTNQYLDRQTRDTLKQYVTLHMQHRGNNGIVPSIQAVSYSR